MNFFSARDHNLRCDSCLVYRIQPRGPPQISFDVFMCPTSNWTSKIRNYNSKNHGQFWSLSLCRLSTIAEITTSTVMIILTLRTTWMIPRPWLSSGTMATEDRHIVQRVSFQRKMMEFKCNWQYRDWRLN